MNHKHKIYINLVAVLLLGIGMVTWVVLDLAGGAAVKEPLKVTADFESSGGVFTNQEVNYRGVLVGQVGEMKLTEDGVSIELVIDPEWRDRIPADLDAKVRSKSAVGEQFVNLTPRSDASEMLEDGDVIPRERTSLPVDFQDLLRSLDLVLEDLPPDKTRNLIENLADGLRGRSGDIATILQSLGTLSDTFASVAPEQRRLLDNATTSGSQFLRTKEALTEALQAADAVFTGLGDEPEELKEFLEQNDRLAREGIALLAKRGDDLARGIDALAGFTTFQLREKASVKQSLRHVPQFLKAIEESAVPWQSPDGRRYYRIRVGLVTDDVPESWPCKYEVPTFYERYPHVRKERNVPTSMDCLPATDGDAATRAFIDALEQWAAEPLEGPSISPVEHAGQLPASGLMWPLSGHITSYFGPRWGRMHTGIDIDGVTGQPVVAAAAGTVVLATTYSGYGDAVIIDHGGGMATLYGHLSSTSVARGDRVEQGASIGAVGCTGTCTGDHLHFEVRIGGTPVDPLPYLPGGGLFTAPVTAEAADSH